MVRTTVVGTYPRIGDAFEEQALRRTIGRVDRGEASEADLRAAEREVAATVLKEQAEAGVDIVTDGLVTWYDSQSHVAGALAGVEIGGLARYFDTNTYYRQPIVRGPVSHKASIVVEEWRFARDQVSVPVKAVLTGPVTLAALALDTHYGKARSLVLDLADALAEEVDSLARAGATHIQVDEPILTRRPQDLDLASDALERIAARKGRATLTLFTYFGDVSKIYRDLLDLPADLIGLDLVQGAKTLAQIAKRGSEKPLVLGLVDARNTRREDPKVLAAQLATLRDAVDLDASYLSPSNGLEFLPRAKAREKLAVLVEAARLAGGMA